MVWPWLSSACGSFSLIRAKGPNPTTTTAGSPVPSPACCQATARKSACILSVGPILRLPEAWDGGGNASALPQAVAKATAVSCVNQAARPSTRKLPTPPQRDQNTTGELLQPFSMCILERLGALPKDTENVSPRHHRRKSWRGAKEGLFMRNQLCTNRALSQVKGGEIRFW